MSPIAEGYILIGSIWGFFLYSYIVYTLHKKDMLDLNISIPSMFANVIGFYFINSITWPITLSLFLSSPEDFEKSILEVK